MISMVMLIELFLVTALLLSSASGSIEYKYADYESLLALKHQLLLGKPSTGGAASATLSSWSPHANRSFCGWEGVWCGRRHPERVAALDLSSRGLAGPLPPSVGNLTFLRRLDLSLNELDGEIPPGILGRLPRLRHLNLSFNSFRGEIPAPNHNSSGGQSHALHLLRVLDLSTNDLTGKIPSVMFDSMPRLEYLSISRNSIAGSIPPSLGNLSSLEVLYLYLNHLEGSIPVEIGGLGSLRFVNLAGNNLSGGIPSSFYNLSSLLRISLAANRLSGGLSADISRAFPNLEILLLGQNHLSGSLLRALQNVTSSLVFNMDLGNNNFAEVVPPNLGKMHNLRILDMQYNELEANEAEDWRFLDSLTNCSALEQLYLHGNRLGGMLPKSIGNLSAHLQRLTLGSNRLSGSIPSELGRYTRLIGLGLEFNYFQGPIPHSIGRLGLLQKFLLNVNMLTGSIPDTFGNLTRLDGLDLADNQLTNPIPSSLVNLQNLHSISLGYNNLSGLIPTEFFIIPSLSIYVDLSHNSFTGTLPPDVGRLINVKVVDFSMNNLTGEIPESLSGCQMLSEIHMGDNSFHGSIPASLGRLKGLEILDLSHNNFSGAIPHSLENLNLLKQLNLSFNNLEGEVPYKGFFANSSAITLVGNKEICGGNPIDSPAQMCGKSISKKRQPSFNRNSDTGYLHANSIGSVSVVREAEEKRPEKSIGLIR